MIGSIPQETYRAICKNWVKTMTTLSESQIHVWTPLSCSFSMLNIFAHDKILQDKLFGETTHKLLFIDGYEAVLPSWEEFEKQFFHFVAPQSRTTEDTDTFIAKYPDTVFGLFLAGFDTAINHGNIDILKHIGTLLEKHNHLSVILLTEQNIVDSDVYMDLIKRHMLIENVSYQALPSIADCRYFLESIANAWQFNFPKALQEKILQAIGSHPLLLEEAARIVRDMQPKSLEEILVSPILMRKARTIFKALSETDQATLRDIAAGNYTGTISEYLTQTGLVINNTIGLPYWNYLYTKHPQTHIFADTHPVHQTTDITHLLTATEKKILEQLIEKNSDIITREDVAKILWTASWEDKYSDWAIDQSIHRLREKLAKYNSDYAIKTKKGEGFLLLEK